MAYRRWCDTRTLRCACGRWADSDGHGQCWVCGERATYPGEPWLHRFTTLLFAPVMAIHVALVKNGWLDD